MKKATPEELELFKLAKQDIAAFNQSAHLFPFMLASPEASAQLTKIKSSYNAALEAV
jgi:hypothetical protein